MFRRKKAPVESRQHEADRALAISQQVARELDELEKDVVEKVRRLRQLNQENNFSAKMAILYGGPR